MQCALDTKDNETGTGKLGSLFKVTQLSGESRPRFRMDLAAQHRPDSLFIDTGPLNATRLVLFKHLT